MDGCSDGARMDRFHKSDTSKRVEDKEIRTSQVGMKKSIRKLLWRLILKKVDFCTAVQKKLSNIEFNSTDTSSHFYSLPFKSDIPPEHIQLLGVWESDAYKKYLELDRDDKVKVWKNMFKGFNLN